jgi:hypothetical protein
MGKTKSKINLKDSFQKSVYNKGYRAGKKSMEKQLQKFQERTTFVSKLKNWFWGSN